MCEYRSYCTLPLAKISNKKNDDVKKGIETISSKDELVQRFSSRVPQHTGVSEELLKHTTPDYLVRDTDLFSLRLSNKKMTTANATTVTWYE